MSMVEVVPLSAMSRLLVMIVIAGNTGGTGAAALSSIKYTGNPWELGLSEAQQQLRSTGMRERVRLRTDHQRSSGGVPGNQQPRQRRQRSWW